MCPKVSKKSIKNWSDITLYGWLVSFNYQWDYQPDKSANLLKSGHSSKDKFTYHLIWSPPVTQLCMHWWMSNFSQLRFLPYHEKRNAFIHTPQPLCKFQIDSLLLWIRIIWVSIKPLWREANLKLSYRLSGVFWNCLDELFLWQERAKTFAD